MKIKPIGSKTYQQIKEQLKQKISTTKQDAQERIKEGAKKAANWVDEKINDPKVKETTKKASDWVDSRINDAKENFGPKVKETAQKTADWTAERVDDAKEAYERLKQKYEEITFPTPKLEKLQKKVTELQREVLFKSAFLNELKRRAPEQNFLIYQREKELQKLEEQTKQAIDKYNRFAAWQAAAQRAFDELNKGL